MWLGLRRTELWYNSVLKKNLEGWRDGKRNTTKGFMETGCDDRRSMELALNCVQRRAPVLAVLGSSCRQPEINYPKQVQSSSNAPNIYLQDLFVRTLISFFKVFIDVPLFLRRFNQKSLRISFFFHVSYIIVPSLCSLKADSHIACRSHAALMPFPCHVVPLRI